VKPAGIEASVFEMCLFPMGRSLLVPPTEKARHLAEFLKVAIILHFILSIFMFVAGRWYDGILDLIAAIIGWLSVRQSEGYSIQQLLCYCVFCGVDVFIAVIQFITYFADVATQVPTQLWQLYIYIGTLIAAPIIYTLACTFSYKIYNELRHVVNEVAALAENGGMGGGGGGPGAVYGGYGSAASAGAAGPGLWSHQEIHPGDPSSANTTGGGAGGFKAFAGQGHRLGGQ